MRVERSDPDGVPHLAVFGELDLGTVDPFKLRIELLEREQPERIVIDLRGVTFMDSMALGILVSHRLQAQQAGRSFALVEPPRHIEDLFRLTGMQDQFEWVQAPASPARTRSTG
ncbi:MAG TPA: STAS domain-containing protein [Thermoleophilaceae bacterium]|nr:STAS domain-containing protein [Thermoleophilaceae bacterium]